MRVSNFIYNHLSSELVPKKRNTTHKSSELKNLYQNIAKYNKSSPLYLLSMSESKQSRMINIKEAAVTLKDVSDCLSNSEGSIYKRKLAYSDNPDCVSVSLNKNEPDEMPEELSISVLTLAKEQVNTGNYLAKDGLDFKPGAYSFTLETVSGNASISFSVERGDTNEQLQKELVQKINGASVSINASIIDDGEYSAIMLASNETGTTSTSDGLYFSVSDKKDGSLINNILGFDKVTQQPCDSQFKINDELHTSTSNSISINQTIELDFHRRTDAPVKISLLPDSSLIKEQVLQFVGAYNNLVDLSASDGNVLGTRSLKQDISSIVNKHMEELTDAGIVLSEDGHLVEDSINDNFAVLFNNISSFKTDVNNTVEKIALDPVAYINKLIVTYPNVESKSGNSYTQSLYSGLLFNNYA